VYIPEAKSGSWKLLYVCVLFPPSHSQFRLTLAHFFSISTPSTDSATPRYSGISRTSSCSDEIPRRFALSSPEKLTASSPLAACLGACIRPYFYDACRRAMNMNIVTITSCSPSPRLRQGTSPVYVSASSGSSPLLLVHLLFLRSTPSGDVSAWSTDRRPSLIDLCPDPSSPHRYASPRRPPPPRILTDAIL
jgi:hypothetical protein